MTHASLFSGIGGFDLAAKWMGWENLFNCEIDAFCTKVLKYHFPNSIHYGNIKETDFSIWRGRIDVLSGGFPCQPFSSAGKRKGTEDNRYLWPEMLRAIRECKPRWIVGENVAGILSMVQPGEKVKMGGSTSLFMEDNIERIVERQRFVADAICDDLAREGYTVQSFVIPACAVGAPHRRDRIFFIAHTECVGRWKDCNNGERGHVSGEWQRDIMQDEQKWCCFRYENREYGSIGASTDTDGTRYTSPGKSAESQRNGSKDNDTTEKHRMGGEMGKLPNRNNGFLGFPQSDTDTNGELSLQRHTNEHEGRNGTFGTQSYNSEGYWANFPTQPPVCSRDDELSDRLDGITFPKWREESVKAYGNAVVPVLIYELFKAIDEVEETYNHA